MNGGGQVTHRPPQSFFLIWNLETFRFYLVNRSLITGETEVLGILRLTFRVENSPRVNFIEENEVADV